VFQSPGKIQCSSVPDDPIHHFFNQNTGFTIRENRAFQYKIAQNSSVPVFVHNEAPAFFKSMQCAATSPARPPAARRAAQVWDPSARARPADNPARVSSLQPGPQSAPGTPGVRMRSRRWTVYFSTRHCRDKSGVPPSATHTVLLVIYAQRAPGRPVLPTSTRSARHSPVTSADPRAWRRVLLPTYACSARVLLATCEGVTV